MHAMNHARLAAAALLALAATSGWANEAVIKKALGERLPGFKVDEVRPTPMPGIWEVRTGSELRYTDAAGNYLIEGEMLDLRAKKNLTEERVAKLTAVEFGNLPLKDAVVWKSGNGKRKIAVFADPNCGYCKRFERALQDVKDLTVYTFVIPILGPDSVEKTRAIVCAKDQTAVWRAWMLDGTAPPKAEGKCDDSVTERNLAFSRRHHINGTPAVLFEDGTRVPGAMSAEQVERKLQSLSGKS